MNLTDKIISAYSYASTFPDWMKCLKLSSLWRHIVRYFGKYLIMGYYKLSSGGKTNNTNNGSRIIISLTSFPARINQLWVVIESLLRQNTRPNKIILWLSKSQFTWNSIPSSLIRLQDKGLEINLVDGDIRSHKKYYYAFKEYPNDYVILVDDDIIYPTTLVTELLKDFSPQKVHCSYGSVITFDKDGNMQPYENWSPQTGLYNRDNFFFGSGGGTILVPASLPQDMMNLDEILGLCPLADDIWLNAMCRRSNLKILKVRDGSIFPLYAANETPTLSKKNIQESMNDVQLKKVSMRYPSLFNCKQS